MQGTASTLVWSQQQQHMESDKNNGKVGKLAYQQYVQFLQGIACSSGTYILLNDTPNPKWGALHLNVVMLHTWFRGLYVFPLSL